MQATPSARGTGCCGLPPPTGRPRPPPARTSERTLSGSSWWPTPTRTVSGASPMTAGQNLLEPESMTDPTQGPSFFQDPYPTYAAMRSRCPVQSVPTGSDGHISYLVTGYAEAREALGDPRLSKDTAAFFAGKGSRRRLHPAVAHTMLASDPPRHTRLRKLVTKAFTTGAVAELRPFIARVTDELLDQWPVGEQFDFVAGLAAPLPVIVICELLGVPRRPARRPAPVRRAVRGRQARCHRRGLAFPGRLHGGPHRRQAPGPR